MPKNVEPLSLRDLAIRRLVVDFELINFGSQSYQTNFKSFNNNGDFMSQPSCLQWLPSCLMNEVANKLIEYKGLKPYIIRSIILKNLTKVSIPPIGNSALCLTLQTIKGSCQNIQSFQLTCSKNMNTKLLSEVLQSCKHIQILDLEGTNTNDLCLITLAESNRELTSLNLTRTSITEAGLAEINQNSFPKLFFLSILGLQMKTESVIKLLKETPSLLNLEYENMLQVVTAGADLPLNLQLRKLNLISGWKDQDSKFSQNIYRFKWLEVLAIEFSCMNCELLEPLLNLDKITRLELSSREEAQFDTISDYLKKRGNKLSCLSLENFHNCDISKIDDHCPRLVTLKLSQCSLMSTSHRSNLYCLKEFYVYSGQNIYAPDANTLYYILNAPNLSEVYIQNVPNFSDHLLVRILQNKGLKKLRFLSLDMCNRIGLGGLIKLLSCENNIEALHLWSCAQIGEFQKSILESMIKLRNFDINLQWQGILNHHLQYQNENYENLLLPLLAVNILPDY